MRDILLGAMLLAVSSVAAPAFAQLIAFAKANPGKLNFGSNGAGGNLHLSLELFKSAAGVDITHAPARSPKP